MSQKKKLLVFFLLFLAVGIAAIAYLFVGDIAVLNPQGMIAIKERDLLLTATWLMLLIVVPVFILTVWIAFKYRSENAKAKFRPDWDNSHLAEAVWWGVPCIVAAVLSVLIWNSCHELDPFRPITSTVKPVKIQAVALQWKWLFIYPDYGIATVNFIQFPENVPVDFEITADAPMNSFWIPELGGQIYAMPGMKAELHLIADTTGSYAGSSANLSGIGFSGMKFIAKSSTQAEFDAWVQSVVQSSAPLDYDQVLKKSSYDPQAFYVLKDKNLFHQIINKYMAMPEKPE